MAIEPSFSRIIQKDDWPKKYDFKEEVSPLSYKCINSTINYRNKTNNVERSDNLNIYDKYIDFETFIHIYSKLMLILVKAESGYCNLDIKDELMEIKKIRNFSIKLESSIYQMLDNSKGISISKSNKEKYVINNMNIGKSINAETIMSRLDSLIKSVEILTCKVENYFLNETESQINNNETNEDFVVDELNLSDMNCNYNTKDITNPSNPHNLGLSAELNIKLDDYIDKMGEILNFLLANYPKSLDVKYDLILDMKGRNSDNGTQHNVNLDNESEESKNINSSEIDNKKSLEIPEDLDKKLSGGNIKDSVLADKKVQILQHRRTRASIVGSNMAPIITAISDFSPAPRRHNRSQTVNNTYLDNYYINSEHLLNIRGHTDRIATPRLTDFSVINNLNEKSKSCWISPSKDQEGRCHIPNLLQSDMNGYKKTQK
ncbi:uncharacterized protein CMU_020330 [Cryptosporidium muris RN66]|uniref:Uncharacterized protein n=1 Tax=Cryptosporidium muris (strain RN66) TaxID=441375 RepID=B6AJ52_CRYMR|nr:uncharacterized protein CMU_020330 [Cryptosporidium muris RN66]EEA08289.1 hypothetical protein, conserved [Cryptosporidium muris RN66]|eukprot:XP_002142638.1 hypothetical protein [Cryptosporidium muris RN66]